MQTKRTWPPEGYGDCTSIEEVFERTQSKREEYEKSLPGRRRRASLEVLKILNDQNKFWPHIFDMGDLGLLFVSRERSAWRREWIDPEEDPR